MSQRSVGPVVLDSVPMNGSLTFARMLSLAVVLFWQPAEASTFRPIPLSTMVERSSLVVVATPISRETHWALFGSKQRVVTDSTIEIAWTLHGDDCAGKDIVVRTLGGTVEGIGQIVYGEARLTLGQSSLLFLIPGRDGTYQVLGMAQGQYPLEPTGEGDWQLRSSLGLEGVLQEHLSVAHALAGRRLSEVPALLTAPESAK